MATIGYARISTGNQRLDLQLDALKASGCTRIHTDTASGALSARPGLDQALAELDEGDTLVVWRLDRLGRSLPHLVATIDNLTKRGVNLKSLHEAIDTTTPTGRLMVHLIASLAEFERELTVERTIPPYGHHNALKPPAPSWPPAPPSPKSPKRSTSAEQPSTATQIHPRPHR